MSASSSPTSAIGAAFLFIGRARSLGSLSIVFFFFFFFSFPCLSLSLCLLPFHMSSVFPFLSLFYISSLFLSFSHSPTSLLLFSSRSLFLSFLFFFLFSHFHYIASLFPLIPFSRLLSLSHPSVSSPSSALCSLLSLLYLSVSFPSQSLNGVY